MADINLHAELRTEFGKGAARRIRRAEQIPAVIYGHGENPIHITLPVLATLRAVRGANALLTIDVAGEEHLALVKDIQRDPVLQIIEHIDLLTVKKGEKVVVDIPVVLTGEAASGVAANQETMTISLSADATHLPKSIEIDLAGRGDGEHIYASDLVLPANSELLAEPTTLIVHLEIPAEEEAEPAAAAE